MNLNNDLCIVHIGIDDFDAQNYGCTTHAATYLLHGLNNVYKIKLIDYPNLVRLNPSIPWKTRGNGAVSLRIAIECDKIYNIVEYSEKILIEYLEKIAKFSRSLIDHDTEPGVVFILNSIPLILKSIYMKALTDVLLPSIVIEKLLRHRNIILGNVFRSRGIVGASAAIGWFLAEDDYTYEMLTYRSKELYEEERCIDKESVKKFDEKMKNSTFNNIDSESGRILIESHGMDPILYGVRGEFPESVKMALNTIRVCEPITAWTVFRSNQGTDSHAIHRNIEDLRMYTTAKLHIVIASKPEVISGGAVIVKAYDSSGSIDLAFFKPSTLTDIALNLYIGDELIVQGHVKPWGKNMVFHVEKMQVLNTTTRYICRAPKCSTCKKRVEKIGWGKGYRCRECDIKIINPELECKPIFRNVEHRLYLPPPRTQKHLIKPLSRYGREKTWKSPSKYIELYDVSQIIEPLRFL
jgi:tRNA(Ile2)-agmatinylcytidine synthase